ncbi:MAG TPA: glutathione peroxidase [Chitinophagaceae bacterium]|jgi:glutathione peroxidase
MQPKTVFCTLMALLCFAIASAQPSTIYSFKIDSITGSRPIDFSAFAGKKILIVNTATLDADFSQTMELNKLQQRFASTLVVVLIPNNDFNKEPGINRQVAELLSNLHVQLIVTAKSYTRGAKAHPLFQWLTQKSLNGVMDTSITGDFQKFLINEQGSLVAVFNATTRATAKGNIVNAITGTH